MNKASTDIIIGDDFDLLVRDGDFVVGNSEPQHIDHLLLASPGTYKMAPMLGIDIYSEMNGEEGAPNINDIRKRILLNAKMDGMKVDKLNIDDMEKFEIKVSR